MTVALLVVAHVVSFAVSIQLLDRQTGFVRELYESGDAVNYALGAVIKLRVLDSLHKGINAPDLFETTNIDKWEADLNTDISKFETKHHGVYLGFGKLRRLKNNAGEDTAGISC